MAVAVATSAEHLRAAAEIQQYKELDIMQLFEADQVEDMEKDVMVFWGSEQVQKQLPMLSQLARCYCAAPVTSVPSERVFSTGGLVMTKKRRSLAPEMLARMVWLKRNNGVLKKLKSLMTV